MSKESWPGEFALTTPAVACALLVLAWHPSRVPLQPTICFGFAAGIALWRPIAPPYHDTDLFPARDSFLSFFGRAIAGVVKESEAPVPKP